MTNYQVFCAENLDQIDPNEGIILDIRTSMEHGEKRLSFGHAHIPLDELKPTDFMMRHGLDKDSSVYILCRSGKRAAQAAEKFIAKGYRNVHVVEGGIVACEEHGHEVEGHGTNTTTAPDTKRPISLERQVRIVAGLMAATGALLALTISPLFSIIPLIVGSGLVFAGVTDRCGIALVLTNAPWNKVTDGGTCTIPTKTDMPAGANTDQSCQ